LPFSWLKLFLPLALIDLHGLRRPEVKARDHVTLFCYVEEGFGASQDVVNILRGKVGDRVLHTPAVLVALGVITQRPVNRERQSLNIAELEVALLQIPDVSLLPSALAMDCIQTLTDITDLIAKEQTMQGGRAIGDQTPIAIDTRIVAATHRDLGQLCREKRFREDLYYRLNVIPIHLPTLRERPEDVPLLVDHFIKAIRIRTEKQISGLAEEALERLIAYQWPGNVRELINVLEYAFVVCQEDLISVHHLPPLMMNEQPHASLKGRNVTRNEQREQLIKALEELGGNRQKAAEALGISRVTLWKLLKKHDIRAELHFRTRA
jgi:Sigma-54 interaction domain/Bacterial regulatory protein, Fis family